MVKRVFPITQTTIDYGYIRWRAKRDDEIGDFFENNDRVHFVYEATKWDFKGRVDYSRRRFYAGMDMVRIGVKAGGEVIIEKVDNDYIIRKRESLLNKMAPTYRPVSFIR